MNDYNSPNQYVNNVHPNSGYPMASVKTKRGPGAVTVIVLALIFGFVGGMLGMYVQSNFFQKSTNDTSTNQSLPDVSQSDGGVKTEQVKTVNINNEGTFPVAAISEKVSPSVVGVQVTTVMRDYFYGDYETTAEGSGVIYSADGYIITNHHVIEPALLAQGSSPKIMVYLPSDIDNPIEAEVIGYDISMDLALIKVDKTGLAATEFGDSDDVNIGDIAVAIGNPGGLEFMGSTSFGVISGLNRTIKLESGANLGVIQTDAAINPGNSGGALANADGKVIGINSAKLANADFEGMGFAVPINKVIEVCERIINKKGAALPYIGIQDDQRFTSSILVSNGYPEGVVVGGVVEGGPAEAAGVEVGDIITKFNGVDTPNIALLNNERNKCSPGDKAIITVYRQKAELEIEVTLAESMQ